MYYKIQPEQIQIHAFSSPSGDLRFAVGSNYVYANLSRSLTGSFALSGSLNINGVRVPVSDPSNFATGSNCFYFGGQNNNISGQDNATVNGDFCVVRGTGNASFNSKSVDFSIYSKNNTALGGYGATFQSGVTGASILKDGRATTKNSRGNNSLVLSYGSGVFVEDGDLNIIDKNLKVSALGSGLFSGDLQVLGNAYVNYVKIATVNDLYSVSGVLSGRISDTGSYAVSASGALSTRISNTGAYAASASGALSTRIDNTGLYAYNLSGKAVLNTGNQTISGNKTFHETQTFSQSLYLKGNSGNLSGISGSTQIVPTGSGHSVGSRGLIAYSGQFLYIKISDAPHLWARHSGTLNWP